LRFRGGGAFNGGWGVLHNNRFISDALGGNRKAALDKGVIQDIASKREQVLSLIKETPSMKYLAEKTSRKFDLVDKLARVDHQPSVS
jgi:hypothetical protein